MKKLVLGLILPVLALGIYDMKWFDLNSWRCPFYNDGRWGIDVTIGSGVPGGTWPQPLRNCYIFGAGVWVGACLGGDTLTTMGYNPNSGGTEMMPTLCRYRYQGVGDSADRVYKYPGDWPPPGSRFPMAPQLVRSEMELWMCYGDSEPGFHAPPGRPLGVDLYLTVYGFSDSFSRDMMILKYELANASGAARNGMYFGLVIDADIGNPGDDMTGLILDRQFIVGADTFRVKNTGFFYDYDNIETPGPVWESGTPGAVAVRMLMAPDELNLSAFKRFTIEIDPVRDAEQYLTLKGYNYRTGEYEPYDSLDSEPGDKRALLAAGPVDLPAGGAVTFYFAVIASPYGSQGQTPEERDTTQLALRCWWAERLLARILGIEEAQGAGFKGGLAVYPNPCRLGAKLRITGSERVQICDLQGRVVRELNGSDLRWDGRDLKGRLVPAGVYFIRPAATPATARKVLLIQR